jgi:hypothetical protein
VCTFVYKIVDRYDGSVELESSRFVRCHGSGLSSRSFLSTVNEPFLDLLPKRVNPGNQHPEAPFVDLPLESFDLFAQVAKIVTNVLIAHLAQRPRFERPV